MRVTRTFNRSGALTLLGLACALLAGAGAPELFKVLAVLLLTFAGPVFAVSLTRHLLRGLLWRVGSRLLVSYLLIGLVPVPLFALLGYLSALIVAGQLAARRAETAIVEREKALTSLADELATLGDDAARAARLARAHAEGLPEAGFALGSKGSGAGEGSIPAVELLHELPEEPRPAYGTLQETRILCVTRRRTDGSRVVAYLPLEGAVLTQITRETGALVRFGFTHSGSRAKETAREEPPAGTDAAAVSDPPNSGREAAQTPATRKRGKPRSRLVVGGEEGQQDIDVGPAARSEPAGSGPIEGRWVGWLLFLERPRIDWGKGTLEAQGRVAITVQTSMAHEFEELFGETRQDMKEDETSARRLALLGMRVVTILVGSVYLISALIAAILVVRIARATSRLSRGFAEIETGNFAFRARLKGQDQLAELVSSFNHMAGRLEGSVAEKAQQESLRHELQVARELQRRLLPAADFRFPGVELAVDFRPADAIGGDFYHFLAEGTDRLLVVIADVSGHGLPTGIVMASAKASLSALATTGTATLELFETLDREIRTTTDSRTFVTLGHTKLVLSERRVEFTNAGHLYPYRVTKEGAVTSLENPSRPLGLGLPPAFRTVGGELAPGDLWVFLSDGIVEGADPGGDPFGFPRLEAVLAAGAGGSAAALREKVLDAWRAHTGRDEPTDDRTLIVLRID